MLIVLIKKIIPTCNIDATYSGTEAFNSREIKSSEIKRDYSDKSESLVSYDKKPRRASMLNIHKKYSQNTYASWDRLILQKEIIVIQ